MHWALGPSKQKTVLLSDCTRFYRVGDFKSTGSQTCPWPSPCLVCRWPLPSAPRVRTGTTTSSCPRTKTCSPPMEQGRLQPSAPLPSGEGAAWCEWNRRARPGPSTTPWWPASRRAPPAQTRAPPTARTLTLPSWTQTTCEQNHGSFSSYTFIVSHSDNAIQ